MKAFFSFALCMVVYCVIALLFCEDILAPIGFLGSSDSLGIPFWEIVIIAGAAIAMLIASPVITPFLSTVLRPPLFLAAWMLLSVFSVGTYADWKRREAIFEFQPDAEIQHSFYDSLREVPREFQFYVHSTALKRCVPYIWSYGRMALVELKPDVAVNVLPQDWINKCGIKRTH